MTNKLKPQEIQTLTLDERFFRLTGKGLVIQNDPTFEDCAEALDFFKMTRDLSKLAIGDILNHVEGKWGEMYSQLVDEWDYTLGYLSNMKSVALAFPKDRRRPGVSFGHYQALQGLHDEVKQEEILDQIEEDNLSVAEVRVLVKALKEDKQEKESDCLHNYIKKCSKCGLVKME